MRFHNSVLYLCMVLFLLGPVSFALGHTGSVTLSFSDLNPQFWEHEEKVPYKGWAEVTVTNTGTEPWGDFHFEIYDPIGGQDISNVHFLDSSIGGQDPSSSQSSLTWTIDNDSIGATIDLYYYSDPVQPNETATFSVYTDNTTDKLSWFGLKLYPTPVPEPASLTLLVIGGLALLRRRR